MKKNGIPIGKTTAIRKLMLKHCRKKQVIKEGQGFPKLFNDEEIVPLYAVKGAELADALDYAVFPAVRKHAWSIKKRISMAMCPIVCGNLLSIISVLPVAFKENKCISIDKCGHCLAACPNQAIKDNGHKPQIAHTLCINCNQCAIACPAKAIETFGKVMAVEEVLREVTKDDAFYARSEGGVTFSDGEPLLQADLPNIGYELLPYHNVGESKYQFLRREYILDGMKSMDKSILPY